MYVEILMVFLFDDLEVFSSNCQIKFAIISSQMRMCILNISLMTNIEQSADIFLGMCPTRSSRLYFLVFIFMYMYFQEQLSIV